MNTKIIGEMAIILGSFVLSTQIYCLKIIQTLEKQRGSWLTNAIDYIRETPITIAILINVAVIFYGILLREGIFDKKN